MIEKLSEYKITSRDGSFINVECNTKIINTLVQKINELVDVVNGIIAAQQQYETIYNEDIVPMLTPQNEEPADPYAEQRKWIGKLCKFWDGDERISHLRWGILYTITPTSPLPFCCSLGDGKTFDYEHCEPVKPDDDIIFKGE